jgi:hypothetical protein
LVKFVKKGGMKWIENFMAGLMCFGGGVLLATVFIHMLPEVRDSLETRFRSIKTKISWNLSFVEFYSKMKSFYLN